MENNTEITTIASSAILIVLSLVLVWLYRAYKSKKANRESEG